MPAKAGRQGREAQIVAEQAVPWVVLHRETPPGSQRERLAKEQADKVALENAVKRGELIFSDQVAEVLLTLSADLASRHDALPGRMASELAGINEPAVIRQRLLDELRAVRASFADAITKLADALGSAEDSGGDSEAAAETDGERVGKRKPRAAAGKRRAGAVAKR
jgi:phage terminase Nu1 subunit (DNA packaging protein)